MMNKQFMLLIISILLPASFCAFADSRTDGTDGAEYAPGQTVMTLEEYLARSSEKWFLTGKTEYAVQAMMVSKTTSFRSELECTDYTVTDDGETVILKGTAGEMWASKLTKVVSTYTKPDGSGIRREDFDKKDAFIDLITIAAPETNFAMHVPNEISVTVVTAWGDVLHTNLPAAPHGNGDFLVCRKGEDGAPDLSDVWILNGVLFPDNYDTSRMEDAEGSAAG